MADPHLKDLEALLEETPAEAGNRERNAFESAAGPFAKSVVLHGAGLWGRRFAGRLAAEGNPPIAFSDNNASLWGRTLEGIPVLAPAEAARRYGHEAAFVVTIMNGFHSLEESRRQLGDLGCGRILPGPFLAWRFGDLLPYFWMDLPSRVLVHREAILDAYRCWEDPASRREYVAQMRWRLTADPGGISKGPFWEPESYFPPHLFDLLPGEVLLDGGAYDGDTIRDLLGKCPGFRGRVLAFEPDPQNRAKLQAFLDTLPENLAGAITIVPCGMWDRSEVLKFKALGDMESFIAPDGDTEIRTVTIDGICGKEGLEPTLIKMDLQGAEPQALEGASQVIAQHRPLLALSVYHRFDDLWRLPLRSRALNADYRYILWPRMHEGWEMLMFAVPSARYKGGRA